MVKTKQTQSGPVELRSTNIYSLKIKTFLTTSSRPHLALSLCHENLSLSEVNNALTAFIIFSSFMNNIPGLRHTLPHNTLIIQGPTDQERVKRDVRTFVSTPSLSAIFHNMGENFESVTNNMALVYWI